MMKIMVVGGDFEEEDVSDCGGVTEVTEVEVVMVVAGTVGVLKVEVETVKITLMIILKLKVT